jgi:hypothetical protein
MYARIHELEFTLTGDTRGAVPIAEAHVCMPCYDITLRQIPQAQVSDDAQQQVASECVDDAPATRSLVSTVKQPRVPTVKQPRVPTVKQPRVPTVKQPRVPTYVHVTVCSQLHA